VLEDVVVVVLDALTVLPLIFPKDPPLAVELPDYLLVTLRTFSNFALIALVFLNPIFASNSISRS